MILKERRLLIEKVITKEHLFFLRTTKEFYYIYKIDAEHIWIIREGACKPINKFEENVFFNHWFCGQGMKSHIKLTKKKLSTYKDFCPELGRYFWIIDYKKNFSNKVKYI